VLGAVLSHEFAQVTGKPAFIVNPPDVDELQDVARITGVRGVYRQSRFHALNHKEVGRRAAASLSGKYEQCNLIIAHIGGGISIAAHRQGRVVDVNDIINGDGPMAPTRCGGVPVAGILDLLKEE
jgi:butyrate kinase